MTGYFGAYLKSPSTTTHLVKQADAFALAGVTNYYDSEGVLAPEAIFEC